MAAVLPKLCRKQILLSCSICLFIFLGFVLDDLVSGAAETRPEAQQITITTQIKDAVRQTSKLPGPTQDLEPSLSDASLSPSSGTPRTSFIFGITYTSPRGAGPVYIIVMIDSVARTMYRVSTSSDYESGVPFECRTHLSEGDHSYYFLAHDGNYSVRDPAAPNSYLGPTVGPPIEPPMLSEESVTPTSGYHTDIYTFTVKYNDLANNGPTYVRVVIDNSSYAMEAVQGEPNYTEGVQFFYKAQLSPGKHSYHFEAATSLGSTRLPANNEEFPGPDVSPLVLTTHLVNASVNPLFGDKKTIFTFSVVYVSPENATPAFVRLRLGDSIYYMKQKDPDAHDYMTGVIFQHQRALPFGVHNYAFEGTNGSYVIRYPPTGTFQGPTVVPSGDPPSLANPAVTPAEGEICRDFVFRVNYINSDNNAPVYVSVVINSSTTGRFAMDPTNSSDYNYTNGAEFLTSIQICQAGKFYFYFEASDGYHIVRTPGANATLLEFQVKPVSEEVGTEEQSHTSEVQNAIGFTGLSLAFTFALMLLLRNKSRNDREEK
ncbi:MAG: hypothetical protein ACFFGZ_13930 [Candidatus Thorarchaeota archaeon]